jgi:MFS-type transporter involved in bile tolerance (Atg22 family)
VAYPAILLATPAIDGLSGGQATLTESIGYGSLINLFCLPGSFLGAILLHKIGRKPSQMFGFIAQGVIGLILGGTLKQVQGIFPLFIVLYGLFIASAEAGPGVSTMLISAEVAPTAIRGHFVGLAAATGKAGAAIGEFA